MYDQLDFGLPASSTPASKDPSARRRPRRSAEPPAPQLALGLEAPVKVTPDSAESDPPKIVPSIRGQVRVETIAREVLGHRVMVNLTSNRSTMISCTRKKGVAYLRIHAIFTEAPRSVIAAAARFVTGERTTANETRLIDDWIEAHRHLVKRPTRELILFPHGEAHDLQMLFGQLNQRYFEGRIAARITWSKSLKNQRRHTIRLGSYCDEQKLIRIHPALDQAFVPEYFVASVVFHEMLHEVHGAPEHPSGRRAVHTPAFNADEQKFHDFERARKWEAKHLSRLLRY